MKVSRPNSKPLSPEELKDLDRLKSLIERATADGLVSKDEMDTIKTFMRSDGKVTPQELDLCQKFIWSKIESGELEYEWE
jgi:uncharacterized membrane protein YebE (DUF533 family)